MSFNYFTQYIRSLHSAWVTGLLGLLLAGMSACGGGGSTSDTGNSATGTVAIGLTDAPGDFVSYTVDVLSIKLKHANGTEVETLPLNTTVDFAQYIDLTELLAVATLPQGRYVEASMILDYSNANILVENADGAAVPVTAINDQNGNPVTTLEMRVQLTGNRVVPIAPGLVRYLSLDFDLASTNEVTLAEGSASIVVDPVLLVDVDRESPRHHRIRGPLQSVDVANSSYNVFIRPFLRHLSNNDPAFGDFTVTTSNTTAFEIDGVPYQGSDGLAVLATKTRLTAVVSVGRLRMNPLRFEAFQVYAGSSVPGGTMDVVQGSVVSRVGNILTVNGATLLRDNGTVSVGDNIKVELLDNTVVTRALTIGTFSTDEISVGQRVMVFGDMTTDSSSAPILSASYARMEVSSVRGNVTAVPGDMVNYLTLSLTQINGRNPAIYDFTGTQASATNYEIGIGTLSLDGINVNNDLNVPGFVTPFGSGPVDYTAQALINNSTSNSVQ